jgi:Tol biopolymer transport system component
LFAVDDSVTLLNAFSPRSRESLVSVRTMDGQTDLWVLDLNGGNIQRQVTFTPSLIESDAYWASDEHIYFIGSLFDTDMQLLRGRVYRMMDNETDSPTIVFESTVFSPSAFLWWYN